MPRVRYDDTHPARVWTVYGVLSKAGDVVYVGIAANVRRRIQKHLTQANADAAYGETPCPFGRWIQQYVEAEGELPAVVTLEQITGRRRDAEAAEREQISAHAAKGSPLLNVIGMKQDSPAPKSEPGPGRRELVNFRLRPDLFDEITEISANGNPSRSQIIEHAIELWLERNRQQA